MGLPVICVQAGRRAIVNTAAIALAFALLASRSAYAADPQPLLTLPTGPAVLVLADAPKGQGSDKQSFAVRVPVTVPADKDITVKLVDVAYKEAHSVETFNGFKVDLDRTEVSAGYALIVSYTQARLWPGTYGLTLRVSEVPKKAADKPPPPVDVVLSVQAPAPQISLSTKVALSFAMNSPLAQSGNPPKDDDVVGRVQLAERGGKIGAFDLKAVAFSDAPTEGDTGTGELHFEPSQLSVHASEATAVAVSASGAFPLGITKGKIEWMSPSLAAPISVPFEVKVTRTRWWIAGIALAGVLLGFLLRKVLTDFQGKLAARDAVTLSLIQASRALEGRSDVDYRRRIEEKVQALDDALVGDDAKAMLDIAKQKADEIKALSDELEARWKPAHDKLVEISALVELQLRLPEPVPSIALSLREQVASANGLLQQRDMSGVDAQLQRLTGRDVPDLVRAASTVVSNLSRFLTDTLAAPFPMSETATGLLRDLTSDATSLSQALVSKTAPSPADSRTLLLSADTIWVKCLGFADDAEPLCRELCENATALLQPLPAAEVRAFEAIASASIAAAQRFTANTRNLGTGRSYGGATGLAAEWLAFLLRVAPRLPPSTAEQFLAKAAWLTAVKVSVDARVEADKQAGLPVRSTQSVPPQLDATSAVIDRQPSPQVSLRSVMDHAAPPLRADDLAQRRQSLLKRRVQTEALRTLGLAAVFVLVVYFVYGEAWIGTYKEMATLFVLAFGLDLTGDGIVAAFKKT